LPANADLSLDTAREKNGRTGGCMMVWAVIIALAIMVVGLMLVVRKAEEHRR
jgi:hypothetical protein